MGKRPKLPFARSKEKLKKSRRGPKATRLLGGEGKKKGITMGVQSQKRGEGSRRLKRKREAGGEAEMVGRGMLAWDYRGDFRTDSVGGGWKKAVLRN